MAINVKQKQAFIKHQRGFFKKKDIEVGKLEVTFRELKKRGTLSDDESAKILADAVATVDDAIDHPPQLSETEPAGSEGDRWFKHTDLQGYIFKSRAWEIENPTD